MKKLIALLLAVLMIASLVACAAKEAPVEEAPVEEAAETFDFAVIAAIAAAVSAAGFGRSLVLFTFLFSSLSRSGYAG